MAEVSRQQIIDVMHRALEQTDCVRAAWLGGSDASGRTDRWSDIDIQFIVEDDSVEPAYETLHAALEALSPIEHVFRFPQPMWHGHEQELLTLQGADRMHMVDMLIIKKSGEDFFLERERHGEPLVLFDKDGLIITVLLDRESHLAKMEKRLPLLRTQFYLYQGMVSKAAFRGHRLDALSAYLSATLKMLVELLRMRHCPERFDYGPRYLDRDLPAGLAEKIDGWVFVKDTKDLERCRAEAEELFTETLRDYDAGAWRLELPETFTDWPGKS